MVDIYQVLKRLNIQYVRYDHPPVFTCEDAAKHWQNIKGRHCKNLFLRNQKGNRHYLIIAPDEKVIDLKKLAVEIGESRFSFGSPERLKKYLGVEPGSVSPFGLINDKNKETIVVIDEEARQSDRLAFHPNVNTATLEISQADFRHFLDFCGNRVMVKKL